MRMESGIRMAANLPLTEKKTITSQFADMTSSSNLFDPAMVLLLSYY